MRHLGKVSLGLLEKVYFSDERFAGAASSCLALNIELVLGAVAPSL